MFFVFVFCSSQPLSNGYIAAILPKHGERNDVTAGLLTEEEYREAMARRLAAEESRITSTNTAEAAENTGDDSSSSPSAADEQSSPPEIAEDQSTSPNSAGEPPSSAENAEVSPSPEAEELYLPVPANANEPSSSADVNTNFLPNPPTPTGGGGVYEGDVGSSTDVCASSPTYEYERGEWDDLLDQS